MEIQAQIRTLAESAPEKLKEELKAYFKAVAAEIDAEGHVWIEYEGGEEAGWLDVEELAGFLEAQHPAGPFTLWTREYEHDIKPLRTKAEKLEAENRRSEAHDAWEEYDQRYTEHLESLHLLIQGYEFALDTAFGSVLKQQTDS